MNLSKFFVGMSVFGAIASVFITSANCQVICWGNTDRPCFFYNTNCNSTCYGQGDKCGEKTVDSPGFAAQDVYNPPEGLTT